MTGMPTAATPAEVAEAFLTPAPPRQRMPLVLENGRRLQVATPEGNMSVLRAGAGPAVLLLHGWEGQASDLAALARSLLAAGCTVLAMDLPAHGDSDGTQTSIPQSAVALRAVAQALGPLHAVVAHSVGAAVVAEALHASMPASRAVLIAAPARYERYAHGFAAAAGLERAEADAMIAWLRDARGVDVQAASLPARAPGLGAVAALFIHSEDDRVVSIEDSRASAAAWPGARHLRVDGLGHRRLLDDPAVIAAAVGFVSQDSVRPS